MATQVGMTQAVVSIIGNLDPSVAKSVDKATKSIKGLKGVSLAVAGATAGAIAGVMAYGTKAVNSAKAYEQSMQNVATLLDGDTATVNKRIQELGDSIIAVSNKTGATTEDLSDGMYQIISALGDSADVVAQMEVASKSAKAGGASTTEAINLLSAVTKGYGDTSEEAWTKASDLAFQTVKLGQTSFPELASSMGKVVPIASALNISQEELFGSFATLTGVTGNTAEVATQMKAVLAGLMTPSADLSKKIEELGFATSASAVEQLGLVGLLDELKESCNGDTMAMSKLFSSVEAQTALLALAGGQADNFVSKCEAMENALGSTDKAFETQSDSLQVIQDKIKNLAKNFTTNVGRKILPYVKSMAEKLLPKVEKGLDNLMPFIDKAIGVIASKLPKINKGISFVMGWIKKILTPIKQMGNALKKGVVLAIDKIRESIKKVQPSIDNVTDKIGKGAKSAKDLINKFKDKFIEKVPSIFEKLGTAIGFVIENFDKFAPAIAGVVAGIATFKTFGKVAKTIDTVKNSISGLKKAFGVFKAMGPGGWIAIVIGALVTAGIYLYQNWDTVSAKFKEIGAKISEVFHNIKDKVGNVINNLCERFPLLSVVFDTMKNQISASIEMIKGIFTGIIDFVKNVFTGNWSGAWQSVKDIFSSIFSGLAGIVKAPLNAVIGIVNKVINSINGVGFSIPDWVPLVGGKEFKLNIPEIPTFAKGGIATTPSICGEGGYPEYVITTDPKYRNRSIELVKDVTKKLNIENTQNKTINTAKQSYYSTVNNVQNKAQKTFDTQSQSYYSTIDNTQNKTFNSQTYQNSVDNTRNKTLTNQKQSFFDTVSNIQKVFNTQNQTCYDTVNKAQSKTFNNQRQSYTEFVNNTKKSFVNSFVEVENFTKNLVAQASQVLREKAEKITNNNIKVEFAPVINCASGNGVDIMTAIKSRMPEFIDMITRALESEQEGAY